MKFFDIIVCITLFFSSVCMAQTSPTIPPVGQPTGQENGQAAVRPNAKMPSAAEMVQRVMQNDKNGDGKLTADEFPPQLQEVFVLIDTNKDGAVDEAELVAFAKVQEKAQENMPRVTPRVRGAGAPLNFEGAMNQSNRGFKALGKSEFNAASKAQDLANVQLVQSGLVMAKGMCATVKMAPQVKEKYGDDTQKYESDMRAQLLATLIVSIDLENAVTRGDAKSAKELVAKLAQEQDEGHDMFKRKEQDEKGEAGEKSEHAPATTPAAVPGTKK